jgi:mannan endo-1,4-beta-mannosidase
MGPKGYVCRAGVLAVMFALQGCIGGGHGEPQAVGAAAGASPPGDGSTVTPPANDPPPAIDPPPANDPPPTIDPPPSCAGFTYSDWGACANGTQTRTVVESSPPGCVGGSPSLSQSCAPPPAQHATMYVEAGRLHDACGDDVVLRGVNKMSIWTDPDGSKSFAQIAKTGANTVRIVWDTNGSAAGLDVIIARALGLKLMPMVELHGATGNLGRLPAMVDYWVRADVLAVVKKYERSLIVNIANEAAGSVDDATFLSAYTTAVSRLRAAGIVAPLVIDAPSWGQNIASIQRTAPTLQEGDPLHNLVFSVHIYWSVGKDIAAAFDAFVATGEPLVIGEFSAFALGCAAVDYKQVIAQAQRLGLGWYAWEWGPGNTNCGQMDMTPDNQFASLHAWGLEVAVTDPNSIQKTSQPSLALLSPSCQP